MALQQDLVGPNLVGFGAAAPCFLAGELPAEQDSLSGAHPWWCSLWPRGRLIFTPLPLLCQKPGASLWCVGTALAALLTKAGAVMDGRCRNRYGSIHGTGLAEISARLWCQLCCHRGSNFPTTSLVKTISGNCTGKACRVRKKKQPLISNHIFIPPKQVKVTLLLLLWHLCVSSRAVYLSSWAFVWGTRGSEL